MTGGRISRVRKFVEKNSFFLTYGDGLSNVNINSLLEYHKLNNKICTVTAVKPEPRFGALILEENLVKYFREKNIDDVDWVNGGFFVCEPTVFDYLNNDDKEVWEKKPLQSLSEDKCLAAYQHNDFWKPMDTLKDSIELNEMGNQIMLNGKYGRFKLFNNKRVFITGHTGFKGSWLSYILDRNKSIIKGYSLLPNTDYLYLIH